MPIPKMLQPVLAAVLNEVETDPEHRMVPQHRREVYDAIGSFAGQQALHWLAVIVAQRVLPMFQQEYPDDTLPQELIETAISVLQGRIDDAQVEEMLDLGCHASGNAWGYDEREIPWPVWLAGNASYHALNEVCGYQPLSNLPEHYRGDVLRPWSDENLCEWSFTDTAAVAAIASASNSHGTAYDSQKLLAFWKWWLTEAIAAAIEAAGGER